MLFIGGDVADYLSVSVLNGLKSNANVDLVDYPKAEVIYRSSRDQLKEKIRGKADFTAFFLHDERPVDRFHISISDLNDFDLVIIGDIQNNFGYFLQLLPHLNPGKTVILDGSDTEALYPYHGYFWRRPYYWFLPRAHRRFRYYKRELTPESVRSTWFNLVPRVLAKYLPIPNNVHPISFAIPDEKIVASPPEKTKDFPLHIVDAEVQKAVPNSLLSYAFESEQQYYADLQASRYGITTKRSGWDCMRHYEIAANGAVICFRDLHRKPLTCAPHGLIDGENCIAYASVGDLMKRIGELDSQDYVRIQKNSIDWARNNSCSARVNNLLGQSKCFETCEIIVPNQESCFDE